MNVNGMKINAGLEAIRPSEQICPYCDNRAPLQPLTVTKKGTLINVGQIVQSVRFLFF